MFLGTNMPGDPGEPREATRRRQEIHWDYDKKGIFFSTYHYGSKKLAFFGENQRQPS